MPFLRPKVVPSAAYPQIISLAISQHLLELFCVMHSFRVDVSSQVMVEEGGCWFVYRNLQLLFFFLIPPLCWPPPELPGADCCCWLLLSFWTTVLMAEMNISSTPVISLLLHSMYLAPILLATAIPCSCVTGVKPWVLRRSMQVLLVRRSDLRPTRTSGVYGQKWRTSGYHCREPLEMNRRRLGIETYLVHDIF